MVDGDVFEARVEHGGVEQHEAHVSAGDGGDVGGVDAGRVGEVVEGADGVVDAHADEGLVDEQGAQAGEVHVAEDGGLGLFGAGG